MQDNVGLAVALDRPTFSTCFNEPGRLDLLRPRVLKTELKSLKTGPDVADFTNRVNVVRALNLPSKAQQLCLSQDEQKLLRQLKSLLSKGPDAFTSLAAFLKQQLNAGEPGKMMSTSSSVYSSRKSSQINLKEALKELDIYYWRTHQDLLHNYNACESNECTPERPVAEEPHQEKSRGRSRRSSIKHVISKMSLAESSIPQSPPLPSDIPVVPITTPAHSSTRSKSWAPTRRSTTKAATRPPSPAPSFHGPSEYINDPDARAKLKAYLTTSDKFQEVLDYGFPSALATPVMKESPVIPPPAPSTRGCNPGLDVQRFMRNNVISWLESEANHSARHSVQPVELTLLDSPMSKSEREVEMLARELASQNASVPHEDLNNDPEHYEREFDISDYEHAIDDSQDDRGTPSPVSPVTPTTPECIPLPLSTSSSSPRRTLSSVQSQRADSMEECLKRAPSRSYEIGRAGDFCSSSTSMVRTAPSIPNFADLQPARPIVHIPSHSRPSIDISPVSSAGARSSLNSQQPRTSPRRVAPLMTSSPHHRTHRAHRSDTSSAPAPNVPRASKKRPHIRTSLDKPLPHRPGEDSLFSPMSLASPISPAAKHHKHTAKQYSYDTPAAYMTPRSPPLVDTAPRQMTLRMTLTRPELRAPDEEIYGTPDAAPAPAVMPSPFGRGKSKSRKHQHNHSLQPAGQALHTSPSTPGIGFAGIRKKHSVSGPRTATRRTSEIEVVRSSSSTDTTRSILTTGDRSLVHPDLPPHVLMREREVQKREPNKLRKARTDPIPRMPAEQPQQQALQHSLDCFGFPYERQQMAQPPLAQMESDGAWRLVPPNAVAAQNLGLGKGEGREKRSLWKKMSLSGIRGKPGLVLPQALAKP